MDREFVGEKWFKYLDSRDFWIHCSHQDELSDLRPACGSSGRNIVSPPPCRRWPAKVFGLDLFFACKKMQDARADYLLLLSVAGQQLPDISQTLGHRASVLAHEAQGI